MKLILFLTIVTPLAASLLTLLLHSFPRIAKLTFFTLLGISGLGAIWSGLSVLITQQNITKQLNLNLLNLTSQFTLDPLAGFFLVVVGIIVISIACYGPSYMRTYEKQCPTTLMSFFTGLFVGGMYLVLTAHDVFTFMFAWELMSIASYFLVVYHHEHAANRRAALLYLLMAQASGLMILFAFSILIKFADGMSFAALQAARISPSWASVVFCLAFFGFGTKAGIVPLHVWLPQAHPVAPSHISALMSGVMLKVAVYGFIRISFQLLKNIGYWQWGSLVLFIGVISALLGVLYALMQHDLKKLLAYHSVENIGIIFIGLGLSLIFLHTGHPLLATLGLVAALYHCLNHAIFKSLLFLGAGAILQSNHEHDLERMGGLIKKMPYTAWCFLIGCISISALPPFNGFVSEWLILQTAFQAATLTSEVMRTLIPIAAALLALTSTLAATCFIKTYGIIFLGKERTHNIPITPQKADIRHCEERVKTSDEAIQDVSIFAGFLDCFVAKNAPRNDSIALGILRCNGYIHNYHDPKFGMIFAMIFLATLCLLFGVLPTPTIAILQVIPTQLIGTNLANTHNWFWLIPLTNKVSSYNALIITAGLILLSLLSYWLLRVCFGRNQPRFTKPWDCGYGELTPRMQYSATAFAMPLRRVFQAIWLIHEKIEKTGAHTNYFLQIGDRIWQYVYLPLERLSYLLARNFARLQGGNIRVYLAYMFITLILLLWVIA